MKHAQPSLSFPGLLLALLVASLGLASCGASAGEAPRASQARIVILTDEAGMVAIKRLPPGAEILSLTVPTKTALPDQVARVLSGAKAGALIVSPAAESTARAFTQARQASPGTLLYAGRVAGTGQAPEDTLLLESAADLVAEIASPAELPALTAGLAELARRAIPGKAKSDSLEEFLAALRAAAPGRGWTGSYAKDPDSGLKSRNHVLVAPSK